MPNLLIVDDSVTVRKMIIAALQPLNSTFGEASSGLDAIEQLVLHHFDAVTLDLNMPDMHGLEFLHFIRNLNGLKHVPIIVITTRGDDITQDTVLNAGANRFIRKPFTPNEVLDVMKAMLQS